MKCSIIASQYLFKVDTEDSFDFVLYGSFLKYCFGESFINFKLKQR